MTYRSRNIHILLIAVLVTVLLLGVLAFAQPEPPSPDEEWYPPAPESTAPVRTVYTVSSVPGTGVPGAAGTVNMRIIDESGRVRSEVYGSERFCLQFVSPYDTFYIFLYEWYPPGSIPSGHWIISGAGPYSLWVSAIVNVCYFAAEVGEPEGLHAWKLWLYNPDTLKWSVGIIRFNYYSFPRAVIERVEYPSDMLIGTSYELRVSVKNLGEIDYSYTVTVDGSGLSFTTAQRQSARVPAKSSVTLSFGFTPLATSPRVRIELTGDGKVLDNKDLVLVTRTLPPGPFTLGDVSPITLKEGEVRDDGVA
ncbi:MAG: hypothetical protein ACPLRU_04290 [Desulfofundulus sp.]